MTFTEFKELGLFPSDISQTDLADLMGVSKQSISYYVSNGIGLDKVEAFGEKLGRKIKLSFDLPEVELYNEPHQKFLKRISDNLKKCMENNYFTLEKMARKSRLPISAIQEVLDCKCNDFKIIMIFCTVVRVTVKFEYIGGKPPMYEYETIWDNSLIYSEEPII